MNSLDSWAWRPQNHMSAWAFGALVAPPLYEIMGRLGLEAQTPHEFIGFLGSEAQNPMNA